MISCRELLCSWFTSSKTTLMLTPPQHLIPRISLLKISMTAGRASKGPRVELQRQGHASLRPFHGRLSELRCPQYVSIALTPPKASAPNLEARLPQCGRAFFIAGHLNSGLENPINRSPADADLSGDLCRSHASVTKRAHLVSLGSGSWRSAHEREADHPPARHSCDGPLAAKAACKARHLDKETV